MWCNEYILRIYYHDEIAQSGKSKVLEELILYVILCSLGEEYKFYYFPWNAPFKIPKSDFSYTASGTR